MLLLLALVVASLSAGACWQDALVGPRGGAGDQRLGGDEPAAGDPRPSDQPPAGDELAGGDLAQAGDQQPGGDQEGGGDLLGGDSERHPLAVGGAETLELTTWNIRNFPTDASTVGRVAELIQLMEVDLVAVQEIADASSFTLLLSLVPGYAGLLSPDEYSPGEYQKTGFVYRTSQLSVLQWSSIFTGDWYAFPRPPLQVTFRLTRPDASTSDLTAIVLHLKAGTGSDDQARRQAAMQALKTHADYLTGAGGVARLVLLGDFNDDPDDEATDNVFQGFLDDSADYTVLTRPLALLGLSSFVGYGGHLYDNLIVSQGLFQEFSAALVLQPDQDLVNYDYQAAISDHRPVVGLFGW